MVMFNIGDVHDANANQAQAFTTIFWNQFNAQRGYNSFNLALAQYLERRWTMTASSASSRII